MSLDFEERKKERKEGKITTSPFFFWVLCRKGKRKVARKNKGKLFFLSFFCYSFIRIIPLFFCYSRCIFFSSTFLFFSSTFLFPRLGEIPNSFHQDCTQAQFHDGLWVLWGLLNGPNPVKIMRYKTLIM